GRRRHLQTEVGRAHALAPDAAHLHPQEGAPEPAPRGRDRRSGVDMQLRRRAEILRRGRRVHRRVGQHLPDHLVRRARRHSSDAGAVRTRVADGAGVAVVAREAVRAVHAAPRAVAAVGGALVAVVAVARAAPDTGPVRAGVAHRASVAVVAGEAVRRVPAALRAVAAVGGALVAVVAVDRPVDAGSVDARASLPAHVITVVTAVVVAREIVRDVHAALGVVALVGGARVPVVAVELGATHAVAVDARVAGGAGVAVVAGARLGAAALALAGAVTGHGVDALLRGARRASRLEPTGRRAAVAGLRVVVVAV